MLLHASSVAREGDAVLLLGPSGSGKSDLVLRMLHQGWQLVADDQVALRAAAGALHAMAPAPIAGLLEIRGLGLFGPFAVAADPIVRLVVRLAARATLPRMPEPQPWQALGISVPAIGLAPFEASAPAKLCLALDAALGRLACRGGAFADQPA